jgi:hypothetical protein
MQYDLGNAALALDDVIRNNVALHNSAASAFHPILGGP